MAYNRVSSFGSTDSGYESAHVEESARPIFKYQEQSKEIARQRQHMLAAELSRLDSEEYQDDILEHMLRMDQETMADVDSIDIQTEIQWFMRPYLLDFLVEAHSAFQLMPETLFLTINLLDRYCSKRVVYKRHYQLVGCAALLIAAKYGDKKEKVPTIKELKSMCCSLYDDDMFLQMEWHVLSTLSWAIGHPTVDNFVQMATKDGVYDPEVENMTLYILEIALYHRDFVSKRSSTLALSALALARHLLSRGQPHQPSFAASFDNATFLELSQKLHEPSTILSRKYASARYSCVSRTLSSILAQKAAAQAAAAQIPLTPTFEITAPSSKSTQRTYFQTYSTPQKPQLPAVVQHGMYTPPITPDTEQNMFGATSKTFNAPSRLAPPTPSPSATQQYPQFNFQPEQRPRTGWTVDAY